MERKKILIISQTIYPAQFPRSFRATELAIELARQGHEVILYAVLGKYDYSQFEKEHKIKIKNIGQMWFSTINSDSLGRKNLVDKILYKLFNYLLEFPDIEFLFRMTGILKRESGIDLLITVAMPHSLHWGCAMAKSISPNFFPRVWAADCGDPFMKNEFIKHPFYFKYMEKWFCKKADYITVPSSNIVSAYYPEFKQKIKIIPQGFRFDNSNMKDLYQVNDIPTFAYAGTFYKEKRDPSLFLEFLCSVKTDFRFIIYTSSDILIQPFVERLNSKLVIRKNIIRHELLKELARMDFLINIENIDNYGSPSKLIDYTLSGRPVLSIDSNILRMDTFAEFLKGDYTKQLNVMNVEQYNIVNVAKKFLQLTN